MLKKSQKRLAEVEKQLEKVRGCSPLTHGWQTQKYSRADRNWDYYAQLRMKLLEQVEMEERENFPGSRIILPTENEKGRII